ncbi:unnamed protein product [Durusdinium trenchii]|uniref:Uncharacterized protein n=2 Tax=Durusdinium trenchii TaxID=1381693 RepID=A0ABP0JSM6_9DINO
MVEFPLLGGGSARDGLQVDRLEVCWMCSGDLACMVDAAPNMSITDVRSQVLERTGVPVEQQRLFCEGSELLHQADFMHVGICGKPTIQLVRCNSDPRNTNRAYFRENLKLPEGPVGNFCHVKKIGAAIYGEVGMYRWAQPNDNSDVVDVAVKCISVQKARQTLEKDTNEWTAHQSAQNIPSPEDAYAEIGVLQYLSKQPDLPEYLLKLLAAFIDDSKIWLVMEMADGGELLDAVLSQKVTHGPQTKQYLWQTLKAVQYLHAHCIGHRDISLENLLLKAGTIRLVDFGNAVQSHSSTGQELRYFLTVGKDTYRAPECIVPRRSRIAVTVPEKASAGDIIMTRESGGLFQVRLPQGATRGQLCQAQVWGYAVQPADIFSCGVCFFCMSYGSGPWINAQLNDDFFAFVYTNGDNGLKDLLRHWGKPLLEDEAMELLLHMIRVDPLARPAAASCLGSSWFKDLEEASHQSVEML